MFPRHRKWLAGAAAAVGVIAALLINAARIVAAEGHDIDVVRAGLSSAEKVLRQGPSAGEDSVRSAYSAAVSARSAADDAGRLLHGPLVGAVRHLPWVSDQVTGADALTQMASSGADALADGARMLQDLDRERAAEASHSLVDSAGVVALNDLQLIDSVIADAQRIDSVRSTLNPGKLVAPLRHEVESADSRLGQLHSALKDIRAARDLLPSLLGRDHPSNYLLLLADNAELRPGGGFIGSYATFGFDKGHLRKPNVRDVYDLENPLFNDPRFQKGGSAYVPAPAGLVELLQAHSVFMRDADWSPDWVADARQAEAMFNAESGEKVDGVVQVDPTALSYLVGVTGPIAVPDYNETVDASNLVLKILQHTRPAQGRVNRKAFLSRVADQFFQQLTSLPSSRWNDLYKGLTRAATERHVFAYFNDGAAEQFAVNHDFGGRLHQPSGDAILVACANVFANKADYWVQRNGTLTIAASGSHQLVLQLHNASPGFPGGLYHAYVRFFLPPNASGVRALGLKSGQRLVALPSEAGWAVYGGYVDVLQGGSRTITLIYSLPPTANVRVSLLKEPGEVNQPVEVYRLQSGQSALVARNDGATDWTATAPG